jgi:heterodisulfide reductase subunit B
MPKIVPTVRCAVYTRKSTEEGLDQDFNSLQAQREAAEAFIKSQKHLGWTLVPSATTMAAAAAGVWIVRLCSGCLKTSKHAGSIVSWCIKWTV